MSSRRTRGKFLFPLSSPCNFGQLGATIACERWPTSDNIPSPNCPEQLRDTRNSSCPRAIIQVHSVATGWNIARSRVTGASHSVCSLRVRADTTITLTRTGFARPANPTSLFTDVAPRIEGVFS